MFNFITAIKSTLANLKKTLVYRSFWGRSSVYKNVIQLTFLVLTIGIFLTGISVRFANVTVTNPTLSAQDSIIGNIDLLPQGGSIQTILVANPQVYFKVSQYTVVSGDTIPKIAASFGISKDTLKWANPKVDYYKENIEVGDVLQVPEIDGVLYQVKSGDTLDSVLAATSGDRFDVIEVNQLQAPNFPLTVDSRILIPNGKLPPPPQAPIPSSPIYVPRDIGTLENLAGISFGNPLANPACAGYVWERGFSSFHNGVDLSKGGGCPVEAIADGEVIFAGWSEYGEGYNVRIYHGNGIESHYYHSNGNIWVRAGDHVVKGQDIMYMGCTGNCTGTHVHLGLKLNNEFIDPSPYVPY